MTAEGRPSLAAMASSIASECRACQIVNESKADSAKPSEMSNRRTLGARRPFSLVEAAEEGLKGIATRPTRRDDRTIEALGRKRILTNNDRFEKPSHK